MPATATVSGNTIVINRDDNNRELVYPISALHTELRKRGAYTDIGLFAGEKELIRVSNWPTESGFGNSIFSLTDPEAISTAAESNLGVAGGGGGGGGGGITQAQVQAAIDASVDVEAIKNRSRVSAFSHATTQTSANGTDWAPLAAGACTEIVLSNTTNAEIWYRKVGETVDFALYPSSDPARPQAGDEISLPCLADSSEYEIRRQDAAATRVTVKFKRYTR